MRNSEHGIECESGRLASATYGRFGTTRYQINRFYDDGDGPVFIYQDAGGMLAIIRARSWEDAWSICQDEIFDDADPDDIAESARELVSANRHRFPEDTYSHDDVLECLAEDGIYPEDPDGVGFRPNGNGSNPWNQTGMYQEDLNGSSLRLLTYDDMDRDNGHGIALLWESWDHDEHASERYSVVVDNVGTVYDGPDYARALESFTDYSDISRSGIGRAGGRNVTLFTNADISREWECYETEE